MLYPTRKSNVSKYIPKYTGLPYLLQSGVGKSAVKALSIEKVVSKHIFKSLKEEHIVRLLSTTIGSHALLWELWEAEGGSVGKHSLFYAVNFNLRMRLMLL